MKLNKKIKGISLIMSMTVIIPLIVVFVWKCATFVGNILFQCKGAFCHSSDIFSMFVMVIFILATMVSIFYYQEN